MKRTDRIGKHVEQQGPTCMLASWCMAGGYRYSNSRVERYTEWLKAYRTVGSGEDEAHDFDRAFGRFHDDYMTAYWEAKPRQVSRRAMATPKFTGHGTLNMWSRGGICHSVAVIETPQGHIIKDPSDKAGTVYTSYASYKRINHTRPTLVTFVEVT